MFFLPAPMMQGGTRDFFADHQEGRRGHCWERRHCSSEHLVVRTTVVFLRRNISAALFFLRRKLVRCRFFILLGRARARRPILLYAHNEENSESRLWQRHRSDRFRSDGFSPLFYFIVIPQKKFGNSKTRLLSRSCGHNLSRRRISSSRFNVTFPRVESSLRREQNYCYKHKNPLSDHNKSRPCISVVAPPEQWCAPITQARYPLLVGTTTVARSSSLCFLRTS